MTVPKLRFREVTAATWHDFEALFERRGGPKYCWCMAERVTTNEKLPTSASRKRAMRKRVRAGTPIGLLAYDKGHPIAWCSIAPRETYRKRLAPILDTDADQHVWSVVCFYVTREHRRTGIMRALLDAARKVAKKHHATILEAYPVATTSPSYRFGGFLPMYKHAGFKETARVGTRRHVVRLRLAR